MHQIMNITRYFNLSELFRGVSECGQSDSIYENQGCQILMNYSISNKIQVKCLRF